MCTGSKGEIFSRWSSVSSEKKKKTQQHKPRNHFQGVKFQLLSMEIQFAILCPARMEPKFANKDHFILPASSFSTNKSWSPSTATDVWFKRKNQMRIMI